MAPSFDHSAVEARWLRRWAAAGAGRVDLDSADGGIYNLVEFPYPSAAGLHIGHAMTYAGADTWGRLQRMRTGRPVFQPIGFDSFGINAENYARTVGRHPAAVMAETTANYRRQLQAIGGAWSWDAEVSTSDPSYYRWTQWIFCRLFEAGLAYQADAPVLWCPSCETVLAREQVEDDHCERCGTAVIERVLRQWFLRITDYADRLRAGLDDLDWPQKAKNRQRRWIEQLHDWVISRQRYWGPPIPIIHCPDCGPVAVPDDDLPVELDADPSAPCPKCDATGRRDPDVSDTFLDSAWYFLRYPSVDAPDSASKPWSAARTETWLPVDHYAGGPEHVVRHHLYARFVTMALHDLGWLPFSEPFPRISLHGMIIEGGSKMSKSRGNVVNPDELIAEYGADVTRLALLFTRPWDTDGEFGDAAVTGADRFVARVWRFVTGPDGTNEPTIAPVAARVAKAIDAMSHNVAIAALMEHVAGLRKAKEPPSRKAKRELTLLLAPLAPFLAEELWCRLDQPFSVHDQRWPTP